MAGFQSNIPSFPAQPSPAYNPRVQVLLAIGLLLGIGILLAHVVPALKGVRRIIPFEVWAAVLGVAILALLAVLFPK